jgi:hypothetical protein
MKARVRPIRPLTRRQHSCHNQGEHGSAGAGAFISTDLGSNLSAGASFGKHLLKPSQNCRYGVRCQSAERANQALDIDRTKLIQRYVTGTTLKTARHSPWIGTPGGRHRRDDHSAQVLVQFVRGHDETGTSLLDFAAEGGIQTDEVYFAADTDCPRYFHSHSSRSKRVAIGSSRRPSCARSRMARAAFAQPVRGRRVDWTTSRPGSACNSTSSGSCA